MSLESKKVVRKRIHEEFVKSYQVTQKDQDFQVLKVTKIFMLRIIDDTKGVTLAFASTLDSEVKKESFKWW